MKKIYFILCIASIGLVFHSCKKNKNDENPETGILGKWNAEKFISVFSENGTVLQRDTTHYISPDYMTVEFKKDNVFILTDFSDGDLETEQLYYKVEGNQLVLKESAQDPEDETYTITITGKKLHLNRSDIQKSGNDTYKWEYNFYLNK
ncbi:MAG: hypothetical protein ABIN48_06590 [Ginsengibacter sp.]